MSSNERLLIVFVQLPLYDRRDGGGGLPKKKDTPSGLPQRGLYGCPKAQDCAGRSVGAAGHLPISKSERHNLSFFAQQGAAALRAISQIRDDAERSLH